MKNRFKRLIPWVVIALAPPVSGLAEGGRVALGVITAPVDETLKAHLDLKHGLVVKGVATGSPVAEILRRNDILLKLDDQLLINSAQLSALVGVRKKGDEIVLDFLRSGKPQQSKIVLNEFQQPAGEGSASAVEVFPGMSIDRRHFDPADLMKLGKQLKSTIRNPGAGGSEFPRSGAGSDVSISINGQKIDLESLLDRAGLADSKGGNPDRSTVSTSISSMMWNDRGTDYRINDHNGHKTIKITEDGKVEYEGPFNTAADRAAVPKDFLKRFEAFESRMARPKVQNQNP